jgi:hypothetical protein
MAVRLIASLKAALRRLISGRDQDARFVLTFDPRSDSYK